MLPRCLMHVTLILVDFPGRDSLIKINITSNHVIIKNILLFRDNGGPLCQVKQKKLIAEIKSHYIDNYSPKKLTR